MLVGSNVDLAAAVHARISSIIGAAINGSTAAAITYTAGESGTAGVDGRRAGLYIQIWWVRTTIDEPRIGDE